MLKKHLTDLNGSKIVYAIKVDYYEAWIDRFNNVHISPMNICRKGGKYNCKIQGREGIGT